MVWGAIVETRIDPHQEQALSNLKFKRCTNCDGTRLVALNKNASCCWCFIPMCPSPTQPMVACADCRYKLLTICHEDRGRSLQPNKIERQQEMVPLTQFTEEHTAQIAKYKDENNIKDGDTYELPKHLLPEQPPILVSKDEARLIYESVMERKSKEDPAQNEDHTKEMIPLKVGKYMLNVTKQHAQKIAQIVAERRGRKQELEAVPLDEPDCADCAAEYDRDTSWNERYRIAPGIFGLAML